MNSLWRSKWKQYEDASNFHNKLQEIFTTDPYFKRMSCYQEVPVWTLIDGYRNHAHRFDWYVKELNLLIELHGRQHYVMTNYGNIGYEDAMRAFHNIQKRDQEKMEAAIEAGYRYLEISYKQEKKLDGEYLKQLVFYSE